MSKTTVLSVQSSLLERGWVIANHKLVSFHAAFLSSLFSISPAITSRTEVLREMFWFPEIAISAAIWYLAWHINVAIHEMGHYLAAARTNNLRKELLEEANAKLASPFFTRVFWYLKMKLLIPWGKFAGIKKEGGNFFPDVKAQNIAVAAAGPIISGKLAAVTLPIGIILIAVGRIFGTDATWADILVYLGRFFGTVGIVALFDRLIADPGAVKAYRKRLAEAKAKKEVSRAAIEGEWNPAPVKKKLIEERLQEIVFTDGGYIRAPWQFRNCIMGGRHTEEQGGNLSFQEFLFVPLTASDYIEAQRVTTTLQTRVIQIAQDSEGLNFVGVGLEGGMVGSFSKRAEDLIPEEHALKVAVQAIEECGFIPGVDVAIALDPAASELSLAFREHTGRSDAVGQYFFWRAEEPRVMSTEEMVEMFKRWIREFPIVSIEDGFAEDDPLGWKLLMEAASDKILIIGDDLVTTKDTTIIAAANDKLINTALIKANQIGTLCETLLATAAAKSVGLALVVSHRSKSPNDVMEADIGFAIDALALKCGGGSNTERLIKYGRIVELMTMAGKGVSITKPLDAELKIADISAREEPTNAGIPTVGVTVRLENGLAFAGATPLGTSAGTDEALHLIDSVIEESEITGKYPNLFVPAGNRTFKFKKDADSGTIESKCDPVLSELWRKAQRYNGKGCLNAVGNVEKRIAPLFAGKKLSEIGGLLDIDKKLLALEAKIAVERGKLSPDATQDERTKIMQLKANLGMNAILSVSLALGRVIARRDGVELSDILRNLEGKIDREDFYSAKLPD